MIQCKLKKYYLISLTRMTCEIIDDVVYIHLNLCVWLFIGPNFDYKSSKTSPFKHC